MISLVQPIKSRILLLGEDLSTFHFKLSFTSSRNTLCNWLEQMKKVMKT